MQTTLKQLSDTKVQFTITLGSSELNDAEQVALTKLSQEIKVPGFRKGKVPVSVAAKHVDPNLLANQTLDDAVSKAVAEAFLNEKLQALAPPQVEVKQFVPGESLEFTAETEIIPAVKLADHTKLTAKLEKAAVTAKEVDELVERMRQGFAVKSEVTRAAQDGDDVIIDFVGKQDGVAFDGGTAQDYRLSLGSNQFIPGFEEGIVGHKTGETFDLNLEFPKDYHAAGLAGAKVVFTTTIKKIEGAELPELDDEFAKKAGPFKNVAELKADIKRELSEQKEREATEKLKDELVGELAEKSNVPVPEVLVDDQMQSIERDFQQNLMYQGLSLDQYLEVNKFKDAEAWREAEVRPTAIKRVKVGLVLAELSKLLKVEATDAELEAHVDLYRKQYNNSPEVQKQFDTPEVRRDIANRLLTEKTVDALVAANK
jgi:trigger factor